MPKGIQGREDEAYAVVAINLRPDRPPAIVVRAYWEKDVAEGDATELRKRYRYVRVRRVGIPTIAM